MMAEFDPYERHTVLADDREQRLLEGRTMSDPFMRITPADGTVDVSFYAGTSKLAEVTMRPPRLTFFDQLGEATAAFDLLELRRDLMGLATRLGDIERRLNERDRRD